MKRNFIIIVLLSCALVYGQHENNSVSTDEAFHRLLDGNKRFIENKFSNKDYQDEIKETSKGQHPYAVILTCSDSRLSPEIVFDESIGRLFVIRVAGNVIDPITLGSIEYAVEHLGSGYILVLGHTSCGAVKAAFDGGEFSPSIEEIAKLILPAVDMAKKTKASKEVQLNSAVTDNVLLQLDNIKKESKIISEFLNEKKIRLDGAVYNISTGKVEFLN